MAGLIGSQPYQEAQSVFNPQTTQAQLQQNPMMSQLKMLQDQARRQAQNTVQRGFQQSGFGRSTFAPQAMAQAGGQAAASYLPQIAQTGQQQQQQAVQNFMNLLGVGTQREQFGQDFGLRQESLDLQRQQFEEMIRQFEEQQNLRRQQSDMGFGLGVLGGFGKLFGLPGIPGVPG